MNLTRQHVRYMGSAFAAGMAVIYFLIGLGVLDIGTSTDGTKDVFGFGMIAGSGFLLWAVLLALVDVRWLWVVGVVFQVFVYVMYVAVSSMRVPPFENWGLTLRIVQLPLLAAMIFLALRAPEERLAPTRR